MPFCGCCKRPRPEREPPSPLIRRLLSLGGVDSAIDELESQERADAPILPTTPLPPRSAPHLTAGARFPLTPASDDGVGDDGSADGGGGSGTAILPALPAALLRVGSANFAATPGVPADGASWLGGGGRRAVGSGDAGLGRPGGFTAPPAPPLSSRGVAASTTPATAVLPGGGLGSHNRVERHLFTDPTALAWNGRDEEEEEDDEDSRV